MQRIAQRPAQHLITTADADDHAARLRVALHRPGEPARFQPFPILNGIARAGQQDDIRILEFLRPRRVARYDVRLDAQQVEIRKIGDVRQAHDHRPDGNPAPGCGRSVR